MSDRYKRDGYISLALRTALSRRNEKGQPYVVREQITTDAVAALLQECWEHDVDWFEAGVLVVTDSVKLEVNT